MNQSKSKYLLENDTIVRINKTSDLRGYLSLNYSYILNTESLFLRGYFTAIQFEYDKTNISERYFLFPYNLNTAFVIKS